jgi:Fic family protein
MSTYIHQLKGWPDFVWDENRLTNVLAEIKFLQARLLGRMEGLGFTLQQVANLDTLTIDVVKSSEIEGEILNPEEVRSSVARRLGMETVGIIAGRNVEGVVEMMLDATQKYATPLTADRLYGWHAALFPTGRSGMNKIMVGAWRNNTANDPMQVISGMLGREKVHFQAPDSALLPGEMDAYFEWINDPATIDPLLKAAIAHLWLVTIHPFEDGNGRIARAVADMLLARADGTNLRFYSMSAQIRIERKKYYDVLEQTQKGNMDITVWLEWFLQCLSRAIVATGETLAAVMSKAKFWEKHSATLLNKRQQLVLNKLLDGYHGQINSSNWAKLTNTSSDTAIRDINDLLAKGVLVKGTQGGRSTNYVLVKG